jgi:hypothetical protein
MPMPDKRRADRSTGERRKFLREMGIAASATLLAGAAGSKAFGLEPAAADRSPALAEETMGGSAGGDQKMHQVLGIDPKNIVDEYRARDLAALSDAMLYRQVGAIVSRPPQRGMTSFTLHAPLEVMARYGLLRLVEPAEREHARLQMVASASAYGAGVKPLAAPAGEKHFDDLPTAAAEFSRMFQQADSDGMEATVLAIAAQFGTASLVQLLTPLALPTLTGASHSHIGLWLLLRHGESAEIADASLLRAAARALAADPKGQMKSFSGMSIEGGERLTQTPEEIEREILAKLANPPKGRQNGQSIRNLVEAGEATGNADRLFGDFIRHDLTPAQIDAAFRAVLRVSAHSMLQDDVGQAKFGWTHCLTLPQSACGLSSLNTNRKLALAVTLVWITSYRSVLSDRALDFTWTPPKAAGASLSEALGTSPEAAAARVWYAAEEELPEIRRAVATQASIRNDIHLVKYTRACGDMGTFDPTHARLYLAAAAHLCALWMREVPRQSILNNLLSGRQTP